jgi:hypothetical protein
VTIRFISAGEAFGEEAVLAMLRNWKRLEDVVAQMGFINRDIARGCLESDLENERVTQRLAILCLSSSSRYLSRLYWL